MMFRAVVFAFVLALTFCVDSLRAQTFRGAIQGTVLDSTGSAVPGAQVTVVSEDTNLENLVSTQSIPISVQKRAIQGSSSYVCAHEVMRDFSDAYLE